MKWLARGMLGAVSVAMLAATGFAASVHATTNDFAFRSLHAEYYLGADSEGRSTLKATETLVADFPEADQNHGIERALPKRYDGHSTSLHLISVTNEAGVALPYTTHSDDNDNMIVRIGDADTYVHGTQTYVITYTQRDVTKYFADEGVHEFYWDINGTQWQQSFDEVSVTVHTAESITPTLNKNVACYYGAQGVAERCEISEQGNVITARATTLRPGENMTIAVGFTAGTFRGYQPTLWERLVGIWLVSLVVTSIGAAVALAVLVGRYTARSNRVRELAPIPVEYIPPKDASVLVSAQVGMGTLAEVTAAIVDLAVRHYVTIAEVSEKTLFKPAAYELTIIKDVTSLAEEEQLFVKTLFGETAVGTTLQTKKLNNNYKLSSSLQQNTSVLKEKIRGDYGLRHKDEAATKWFRTAGHVLLVLGIATISPLFLLAAIVAYSCGWMLYPLTDEGLELRRYLAGLKMYIGLAEKDRLAALQSPEGAEKTGVHVKGETDKKIVRLYERVLPYAILFGQEKEWSKQLAVHYEDSGVVPSWYVGQTAFNAAVFTGAMSNFSSSMNSYGTSTSSSSGGSSGGGFSGGGGGGGGGGGW